MKTVLVTINTPGSQTGPNFNIFSNVDLVTPLVSSVAKSSLLSGYSVTTVPDAATSIRVKSIGTCTTYVDLSIVTPTTTTTTTVACTTVYYGYGVDQSSACQAYIDYPEAFQYNGKLFLDNYSNPCGPGSVIAGTGYYSDGTDIYFWDGTTFTFDSTCGLYSLQTITLQAKRGTGTISATYNNVDILYSTDAGTTWTSAWTATSRALSTTFANVGSFQVFHGTEVLIGMRRQNGILDISFGVGTGIVPYDSCGLSIPYNLGPINSDAIVYLQAPIVSGNYALC